MSYHLLTKLSRDLNKIFETKAFYDVIIRVGNSNIDAKEFQAHSLILRARVPYFHQYLQSDQAKQEYDKIVITNNTISPTSFEFILKYIYTSQLEFTNCDGKQALDLLFAADDLGLEEALVHIQEYLIYQQSEWMDQNFYLYHKLIYSRKSFSALQNHYTTKISLNPLSVFEAPLSFNPAILSSLDEVGCLKLNETTWGFIVNWAKLQIPTLTNQVTKWNKKDWEEFKETLSPCIPWKSIMNLNWNEFHDLLISCEPFLPTEKFNIVLMNQLRKACSSSTIKSPISFQFNETILNICHATLISSWIDKRDTRPYLPADIPYEFKLVVRGRRDGFSPDSFHLKCGNLQRTVVVFKMSKTAALYGGYNPLDWKFDHTTTDSFIFHFDHNVADLTRLDRCVAIQKKSGYGPCFGAEGLLGFPNGKRSILWMTNDNSNSLPIVDYEVYQIFEKPKRPTNITSSPSPPSSSSSSSNHSYYTHKKR